MATSSLLRRALIAVTGLAVLAPLLGLAGCAAPEASRGTVGFAVSTTSSSPGAPLRINELRTLSHHVNLQEPIMLGSGPDGDRSAVTITFALRHYEGATLTMDSRSLVARGAKLYTYPAHARRPAPPIFTHEPSRVTLEGGGSVSCWTDEETGRVFAQLHAADGSDQGEPAVVTSSSMSAFGAPRAVTSDGRHVVITFFSSDEDGFALVAASLEAVR